MIEPGKCSYHGGGHHGDHHDGYHKHKVSKIMNPLIIKIL